VTVVAHAAFLSGLRLALVVAAAATFAGAMCGPFIRTRSTSTDHHPDSGDAGRPIVVPL
jgi:hypothetical protein